MAGLKLVLASFNRDKIRELRMLLAGRDIEIVGLHDVRGARVPPEVGKTLAENALIKARAAHDLTGLASIADDTGLEVDALGGRPGIYAARFAGPGATGADNVNRLIEILEGVVPERRGARFRTACAACLPDGRERVTEGVLEGRITDTPRGANGFGYDPVFEVAGLGKTLAELGPEEKNRLSHRAIALRDLLRQIELI